MEEIIDPEDPAEVRRLELLEAKEKEARKIAEGKAKPLGEDEEEVADAKWREERAELRRIAILQAESGKGDPLYRPDRMLIRRESAEIHFQEQLLEELKDKRVKLEARKKLIRQESAELHHQELEALKWREERARLRKHEADISENGQQAVA